MHFLGHFRTITRHRHKVIAHCAKAGILWQGLFHDLSKYSPTEFLAGARYYTGKRSPNEGERAACGYSSAWLHHKGRNKHHFEYWTDYNMQERRVKPVKMPLRYAAEMFCDRVAASKIYQGKNYTESHPYDYFARGEVTRFIHPDTSELVKGWLLMLRDKGEKETFAHIRRLVKSRVDYGTNDIPAQTETETGTNTETK